MSQESSMHHRLPAGKKTSEMNRNLKSWLAYLSVVSVAGWIASLATVQIIFDSNASSVVVGLNGVGFIIALLSGMGALITLGMMWSDKRSKIDKPLKNNGIKSLFLGIVSLILIIVAWYPYTNVEFTQSGYTSVMGIISLVLCMISWLSWILSMMYLGAGFSCLRSETRASKIYWWFAATWHMAGTFIMLLLMFFGFFGYLMAFIIILAFQG